jgi:hypothetical protein
MLLINISYNPSELAYAVTHTQPSFEMAIRKSHQGFFTDASEVDCWLLKRDRVRHRRNHACKRAPGGYCDGDYIRSIMSNPSGWYQDNNCTYLLTFEPSWCSSSSLLVSVVSFSFICSHSHNMVPLLGEPHFTCSHGAEDWKPRRRGQMGEFSIRSSNCIESPTTIATDRSPKTCEDPHQNCSKRERLS